MSNEVDLRKQRKIEASVVVTGTATEATLLEIYAILKNEIKYCIDILETWLIPECVIKTIEGYMPYFIIKGTLENYGIVHFDNVDEVIIEGTIINENLIIFD